MMACAPSMGLLQPMAGRFGTQEVGNVSSVACGGQQALNSYRNAGAALLQAMQHRESAPPPGNFSRGGNGAAGVPAMNGAMSAANMILSTSPGSAKAAAGCGLGDVQPPLPQWGVPPPMPGQGGTPAVQPSPWVGGIAVDASTHFSAFGGSDVPIANLGLLTQAGASIPTDVAAPDFGEDVRGVAMFSDSMVRNTRNTFIDFKPERSPSVERFFEERKCQSSPTSRRMSRQGSHSSLKLGIDSEDPFGIVTPTDSAFPTPISKHGVAAAKDLLHANAPYAPAVDRIDSDGTLPVLRLSHFISDGMSSHGDTVADAAARLAQELRHGSTMMPKTALNGKTLESGSAVCSTAATSAPGSGLFRACGSASSSGGSGLVPMGLDVMQHDTAQVLPSRGSALHAVGACKPCAFVFQDGCANGTECEFCHLCDPGERKRRKKERRKMAASWKGRFDGC